MGSYSYKKVFLTGTESLTPSLRRTRHAFEEHFYQMPRHSRGNLISRFRLLARYMKFRPDRWPLAFDRLFSMKYEDAQRTVNGYRLWHNHREAGNKIFRGAFTFMRLSSILRDKGAIDWQFRHIKAQQAEERWQLCPGPYRKHAEEFLREGRARNLARGTLWILSNDLTVFGLFLARHKYHHLKLSYEAAVSWFEEVRDSGTPPRSMNRRLLIIKRFYSWLVARRLLDLSPLETLRAVREPSLLPRLLTEQQMGDLINNTEHVRDRAILEVLYSSGCRLGDLKGIDLPNVSFEERTAKTTVKGGHESILYFNDSAISALRRYLEVRTAILEKHDWVEQPALFVNRLGARFSGHGIRAVVHKAARRALPNVRVYPHMFRHSFATHMLNRGADVFSIMRFLGHKDIQSTIRYLQIATARLSEVHRKFHPRR